MLATGAAVGSEAAGQGRGAADWVQTCLAERAATVVKARAKVEVGVAEWATAVAAGWATAAAGWGLAEVGWEVGLEMAAADWATAVEEDWATGL